MNYNEFLAAYTDAFRRMMSYSPDEVGSSHYARIMADLADEYPDYAEMAESA